MVVQKVPGGLRCVQYSAPNADDPVNIHRHESGLIIWHSGSNSRIPPACMRMLMIWGNTANAAWLRRAEVMCGRPGGAAPLAPERLNGCEFRQDRP